MMGKVVQQPELGMASRNAPSDPAATKTQATTISQRVQLPYTVSQATASGDKVSLRLWSTIWPQPVLTTSGGCMAMLTSGFKLQHGVS